jgi:glycerol-1-phosphate dehydrogenase [NAD(P)+]
VATYVISQLQGQGTDRIAGLFDATGFWTAFEGDPLDRNEWVEAFKMAPTIKQDFYTILSECDYVPEFLRMLENDSRLRAIFSAS